MELFLLLLTKILPLYLIIFAGFLAGRKLKVNREAVASLLIYVIAPVVVFNGVYRTKVTISTLLLPLVIFLVCCTLAVIFYKIAKHLWKDSTKNILGFTTGAGNVGYFGLPVALAVFGESAYSTAVLIILGVILYENTLGFFITARGNFTVSQSLHKLAKLPTVYAYITALVVSFLHITLGPIYADTVSNFTGAYIVLGMMLIGLAVSSVKSLSVDLKFMAVAFTAKFLFWPLLILAVIALDTSLLHLFSQEVHRVMLLMSSVPLAANTVAYATALDIPPEKAAVAVTVSTLLALFYIPLVCSFFI